MTRRVTYRPCRLLGVAAAVFLFLTTGCNQHKDQEEFLRNALMPPSGITHVTFDGQVEQEDPDDWRSSPFFNQVVEVFPATPNPALTSDMIRIDVDITGIESINGLVLYVYNPDRSNYLRLLDEQPGTFESGIVSFNFNASELTGIEGTSAVGDHRVLLYDSTSNIISYGDIRVE